jgi:hypothetical protein
MKQLSKEIIVSSFVLVVSASALFPQPYTFDENGNGIQYEFLQPYPLSYEVVPDPTGGITTSPVLIYSLSESVVSGDVALMEPDGSTVADLLRFFTPAGADTSDVIFYSQVNGTLAGVGIPYSANPVEISEVSPETVWNPGPDQPGQGTLVAYPVDEFFRYTIITEVPEPSMTPLLLVAAGVWLKVRSSLRKGCSLQKGSVASI